MHYALLGVLVAAVVAYFYDGPNTGGLLRVPRVLREGHRRLTESGIYADRLGDR